MLSLFAVQGERLTAREDTCRLLRGLVVAAVKNAPQQRAAANTYIANTPLRNCHTYAQRGSE